MKKAQINRHWLINILIPIMFFTNVNLSAQSDYIVLTTVSDTTDEYYNATKILSDYRNGQIIHFNPNDVNSLLPVLLSIEPRYVAIVIKPIELDINFVREFFMMSTELDPDPFTDFSYGYITGATGTDATNFVNTIIQAESDNIENFPLNMGGCVASSVNMIYPVPGDFTEFLNPESYSKIFMETNDNGSGVAFFNSNKALMENNKILDLGHNGDAHMLWLFEGGNMNPNPPVWDYDPAKIEDTAYARVGLSSYEIQDLDLYPAVAFNGGCHSGEPKRVMVESDIAATFGDTHGYIEFYTMSDTFSFCLTILNTGITGYFAPCGANNANDQGEEVYNTFLYNEPLGDIHKRNHDGVVMGFLGNKPELKLYTQGEFGYGCDVLESGTFNPEDWSGACYMLGGKANRIYYGDPLFNPYQNNHDPQLNITTSSIDSINDHTMDISLFYDKPESPYFPAWDKFHYGNSRIYLPIELPDYIGDITSFVVIDSSGSYDMAFYVLEDFVDKRYMHIEVDIPDDMLGAIDYDIKFRVNYINTTDVISMENGENDVNIYPNPTTGVCVLAANDIIAIEVSDVHGHIIMNTKAENEKNIIDLSHHQKGLYFVKLTTQRGIFVKKVIVK